MGATGALLGWRKVLSNDSAVNDAKSKPGTADTSRMIAPFDTKINIFPTEHSKHNKPCIRAGFGKQTRKVNFRTFCLMVSSPPLIITNTPSIKLFDLLCKRS
jgi:hypothetical protein